MNKLPGHGPDLRLLVLAPNWLGDVVMLTPLLSLLHEQREAIFLATGRTVAIHLGVRRVWAGLFHDDQRIDDVIVLERNRRHRGIWGAVRLAALMRQGDYHAVILAPPSLRAGLASWMAGIPCRVGYRTDARSPLLTNGLTPAPRGSLHYSMEMINLGCLWLESLGLGQMSSLEKNFTAALPGCDLLSAADPGPGPPVWAVAPGTTYGEAKTWPVGKLGDFIELAISNSRVRIVLLGDEAARGFTSRLRERFEHYWSEDPGSGAAILDLTGKTDLLTAAAVLKSSTAFIGNDSGLMHLAAALDLPTVGVFGSSNPDWTAPLGRHTRAIIPEGFSCRPCYRKTCNQEKFCLETVTGDSVLDAVVELVGGAYAQPEES